LCLDCRLSDHRPILLLDIPTDFGPIPFQFFHAWFNYEGFDEIVEQTWRSFTHSDRNGMIRFKKKLQDLKAIIRQWTKDKRIQMNDCKQVIKEGLCEIDKNLDQGLLFDSLLARRRDLNRHLEAIKSKENADSFQKSKIKWAIEGDENSKFFMELLTKKDINLRSAGFSSMVYGKLICVMLRWLFTIILKPDDLERGLTHDEIQTAVWSYGYNKSSSSDGYSFEFFKKYWSFVGPDLCEAVEQFFTNGAFSKGSLAVMYVVRENGTTTGVEWRNYAKALHGLFKRRDHKYPTLMSEAVPDQKLWIWHAYFGVPEANKDLNVLYGSQLFDDKIVDIALECPFAVNGHAYRKGYYLADGIYPTWSTFVKTFSVARDEKTLKFKRVQESSRKYIKRAFRVLQGRIRQSARAYQINALKIIIYCCIILHNMILDDEGFEVNMRDLFGFAAVLAVLKPERLKADRARTVLAVLKPERLKADRAQMCEEASKVESCPSEIILDDLLALDSIVRFDLGDQRLEQTATFSISTNSDSSSISVGTLPLFSLFSFLIFPKDFYSNLEDCPCVDPSEKASMKEITVPNEVTDPVLGFPNPASQCHTCGAKDYRTCEGFRSCASLSQTGASQSRQST
nr:hypothetical protein [Tanacetum cinerariifolium]